MSFLVAVLLALAAVGTVVGAAFYFGFVPVGGGVATASTTPRASLIPQTFAPPSVTPAPSVAPTPEITVQPTAGGTYVVQAGDFLSGIGEKFGVPWQLIAEANNILPPDYVITPGQTLIIPVVAQPSDGSQVYVVVAGDNITKIATKFGIDPTDLADFNNIADWNSIQVGQVLHIPGPGWTPLPEASPTPK
jgi:LysM repeat protein